MANRLDLAGVHRVRRKLADGTVREHHYAWRGGPKFWTSDSGIARGSSEYLGALADAAPRQARAKGKFRAGILKYIESQDFARLSPRYQSDIKTSLYHPKNGIDAKFGDAPLAAFNDPRIRGQVIDWRDGIGGKVGDDRKNHLVKVVAWLWNRGDLAEHRLRDIRNIYQAQRADIIWHDDEIEAFVTGAPDAVGRILIAATETGLRPGDLLTLSRFHIRATPAGRRIVLTTAKRKRMASIPVTARMGALIDATAAGHTILLCNQRGQPYRHQNYLGDAVSSWRDKLQLRKELRLYDARGTAATRLLAADASLKEIATAMSWSLQHAARMIETYVALHPDMTDQLGAKLEQARNRSVNGPVNGAEA